MKACRFRRWKSGRHWNAYRLRKGMGIKMKESKNQEKVTQVTLKMVKKHKWLAAGILCAVVGAIVFSIYPPLILGKIVDRLTIGDSVSWVLVWLYFGVTALTGFTESVREGLLTVFGQKITHGLRSCLMGKLTRLTADELSHQEPGALVSRFVGDVDTVENLFTSGIISMFADACRIISIVAVIWLRNRGLAIVLLVLLPFLFAFTRHVQKNMLVAQLANRRAVSRACGFVPETLHNIRTIHTLGKEKYVEEKYDGYILEGYRTMERTNFYDAIYSPVILILNAIVVAVVMLLSASGNSNVLVLFGMSAGTAVAVMNYITQIFGPVESLGMEIQTIQSAIAGVRRINEFLALEERAVKNESDVLEENREGAGCKKLLHKKTEQESAGKQELSQQEKMQKQRNASAEEKTKAPYIDFHAVTFGYGDHKVLDGCSFQVEKGEQVTLAGRTGAGKSTIFKLLLGLYEPQEGQILIGGRAVSKIKEEEKRSLYGYVEQSFHRVPGTVADQITLFEPSITRQQVEKAAALAGLDETIRNLKQDYDTPCTPELFSQGQWQLLSIARAAAAQPQLLLLDEITANLDAETEKTVLEALRRVSEERTVISISHRVTAKTGRVISIGEL